MNIAHVICKWFLPGVEVGLYPFGGAKPRPRSQAITKQTVPEDGEVVFTVDTRAGERFWLAAHHSSGEWRAIEARAKEAAPVHLRAALGKKTSTEGPFDASRRKVGSRGWADSVQGRRARGTS